MADIAGLYKSNQSYNPKIDYNVSYSQTGRNATSVTYSFTVSFSRLNGSYGYDIQINYNVGGKTGKHQILGTNNASTGSVSWSVTCSTDAAGGTIAAQIWSSSNTDSTHWQNGFDTGSRTVNKSTFNTAPSAPGTVYIAGNSGNFYTGENTGEVWVSWGAATDPNNNLSGYRVRVSINGGGWSEVGKTSSTGITHNISGYGEGTTFTYLVDAYDSYGLYGGTKQSGTMTKNYMHGNSISSISNGVGYGTRSFTVNFSRGSNNNGGTVYTHIYSDHITIYKGNELTSGTSQTIYVRYDGDAEPNGPYFYATDMINLFRNQSFNGNMHIGLRSRNDYGTYRWAGASLWVDMRVNPQGATNGYISEDSSQSTCMKRQNATGAWYFIPNGSDKIRVYWTDGWSHLGDSVRYEIYASFNGGGWTYVGNAEQGKQYFSHYKSAVANTTSVKYLIRCVTSYGYYTDITTGSVNLYSYSAPSMSHRSTRRGSTSADVYITISPNGSVPNINIHGNWYLYVNGSSTTIQTGSCSITTSEQTISLTNLDESTTYWIDIAWNDDTGWSSDQIRGFEIGPNKPIFIINKHGIGVGGVEATSEWGSYLKTNTFIQGSLGVYSGWVGSYADMNDFIYEGKYGVGGTNIANSIDPNIDIYGVLEVKVSTGDKHNNESNWIWQTFRRTQGNQIFVRSKTNQLSWTGWQTMWTTENFNPANYMTVSGGIFSGEIEAYRVNSRSNGDGMNFRVGDDAYIGDVNVEHCAAITSTTDGSRGYLRLGGTSMLMGLNGVLDISNVRDTGLHFSSGGKVAIYAGVAGSGQDRYVFDENYADFHRDTRTDRIKGHSSMSRLYMGDGGNCRFDCTSDSYGRWYCAGWENGAADNGIMVHTNGSIYIKSYGTERHAFYSNGTKVGGTIDIDGMTYGMSPTDSPRALIEDIYFDIEIDGETEIKIHPILAKSIHNYAIFPASPDVRVVSKNEKSFIVHSYQPIKTDIRLVGTRIDVKDQYYNIMGGIIHGDETVTTF